MAHSFRDRDPIVVGLVSATVLLLLVAGVFFSGTLGLLKDRYGMSGVFADIGGLRPGDEVRVAGIGVGEVTAVRPQFRRGYVIIDWKVDGKVQLGTGTRAEIRSANLLGGRYLRLSGPVAGPYLRDLPASRRRIPLERTQIPTGVNEVLKKTTQVIDRLDTAALNRVIGQINGISAADRGRLGHALQSLTALAQTVDENDPQIQQLLNNGDRIVSLISAKDRQLSRLLTNAQTILDELRARRTEATRLLGHGSALVRSLSTLIDKNQGRLDTIMSDLRTTLGAMRPHLTSLDKVLAWVGPTVAGMAGISGYGPWIEGVFTQLGPLDPQDLAALAQPADPGEGRR